jgi:hypothetical protein
VLEDPEIITLPLLECHLERFAIKVFQANKVRSGRGDPSSSRFNSKISDLWLDLLKGHAKQLHGLLVMGMDSEICVHRGIHLPHRVKHKCNRSSQWIR